MEPRGGSALAGKAAGSFRSQGQRLAASLLQQKRQACWTRRILTWQQCQQQLQLRGPCHASRGHRHSQHEQWKGPHARAALLAKLSCSRCSFLRSLYFFAGARRRAGHQAAPLLLASKCPREVGETALQRQDSKKGSPKPGQAKYLRGCGPRRQRCSFS